ncbi:MAG TPA: copper uptake system-associated protein [Acidiferrobacterales bacterium]|nr:copper uptake system-associated protein [Acidiferrobacterales bacterium]
MNILVKATGALLIVFSGAVAGIAGAADDAADIRALIGREFDRPGAAVVSDPIVSEREFALADWVQGEKGGRALLRKKDGRWAIMLCAGDEIREAGGMVKAGVPQPIASALASRLASAESNLPASQVKMFGRFGAEKRTHDGHTGHR